MTADSERWLPAVGFEGRYEISDQGRVAGLPTINRPYRRVLAQFVDAVGYRRLGLYGADGRRVNRRVHTLIAEAFICPRPTPESVIRHLDGNPLNNDPSNLKWGTLSENVVDSIRHGTQRNIRKTHCPKDHEYDARNTGYGKAGNRACRACRRDREKARRARIKEHSK
jgi:hypothetical protein